VSAGDTGEEPVKLVTFLASCGLRDWAKANRGPWEANVCALAAKHGQVEALQWAWELDCPWDTHTCAFAVFLGSRGRSCGGPTCPHAHTNTISDSRHSSPSFCTCWPPSIRRARPSI